MVALGTTSCRSRNFYSIIPLFLATTKTHVKPYFATYTQRIEP